MNEFLLQSSRCYVPPSGRRYEGRRDDDRRDDRGPPRHDDGGWKGRAKGGGGPKNDRCGYRVGMKMAGTDIDASPRKSEVE